MFFLSVVEDHLSWETTKFCGHFIYSRVPVFLGPYITAVTEAEYISECDSQKTPHTSP